MSNFQEVQLKDEDGDLISSNHPLATNGDSVYSKDIDVGRSIMGDFSGLATDVFDNLHSEITNLTATNPKLLTIHFKRTIVTPLLGIGSSEGGNFSNVKLIGILSGDIETTLADFSSDNTDRTTQFFQFPNAGLNAIRLEFHTADQVDLTNVYIPKLTSVSSVSEQPVKFGSNYGSPYLLNGASQDMNVDGSVTPVDFEYTALGVSRSLWFRSFIDLQDGTQNFDAENFGAISGGLTNGVDIIVEKSGVETIIENWKINMDISMTMYDFDSPYKLGSYIGRWTITSDMGNPITLFPGDKIICRINDNLTALDKFRIRVKLSV